MKNVAVINTVLDGSTGKIAYGLHKKLIECGYNSVFCYGYGKKSCDNTLYRIESKFSRILHALLTRLFGGQGMYSNLPTKKLIKNLVNKKIDTIYVLSLHGYYISEKRLFEYVRKNNIRLIYIMIDEYPYVGKCAYKGDCKNYLTGCGKCPRKREYPCSLFLDKSKKMFQNKMIEYSNNDKIVFVGPQYVIEEFKKSPLSQDKKHYVLDEAINLELFKPYDSNLLRQNLGITDNKIVILCVAPLKNSRKGCNYFIELAKRFQSSEKYVFIHVGNDGKNKKYGTNFIPIAFISDQKMLAKYYSMADLFVFPSLMDTMPNACLEALACGTKLLCFNVSGMPYLADDIAGKCVEPRDINSMCKYIETIDKKTTESIKYCRNYAKKRYDQNKYYTELIKIGNE